ncbi:MAG: efflux RND transporter periplasmic adaptor subunit [Hyphomicrobiaceae bacterium]
MVRVLWVLLSAFSSAFVLHTPLHAARENEVTVRGIVRPGSAATISTDLVARVAAIPLKAGQSFRKGDLLLSFDCRRYEADLRAAEADVKAQQIVVETNRLLLQRKATGSNELALAVAKLAQATATADSLRIRLSQCAILAPYNGHIVERLVDVFEMPQSNSPLMKIVKDADLEVDVIVPSNWSAWLKVGDEFQFLVEETRSRHTVRIMYIGAIVEPVSRTLEIWGRFTEPAPHVLPGMSGSARISPPQYGEKQP